MELDRKSIERRDFQVARRGYDPAEVDAHLARIADAVEGLRGSSTAGAAADRVRSIIEAAERSAAEIEAGARAEAERNRSRAGAEAAESLRRAEEAEDLLAQASAELERLRGALGTLRSTLQGPEAEAEPAAPRAVPEPVEPEPVEEPEEGEAATVHAELPEADEPDEEAQETPAEAAYEAAPPAAGGARAGQRDGAEGARLIALNMALNGTPREETERYLQENFELDDTAALLDDVYSG